MSKETDFKQNLEDKAEFQNIFFMYLLFAEKPAHPSVQTVHEVLKEQFGQVDVVSDQPALSSYAIWKYPVEYKDGQQVPAQAVLSGVEDFDPGSIDAFTRSQFWDTPDGSELIDSCHYQVMVSDMMSAGLPYKKRCTFLMDWLETALALFQSCTAVYFPASGKLFRAEQIRDHEFSREERFLSFCVNARYFTIQNSEDEIVDTLGLYAIGLPDVQYHYHGLDPNQVVAHAYSAAAYIYETGASIKNGETIDGLLGGVLSQRVQWPCRYEDALIQPVRCVMDICPGEYAAGKRN